MNKPTCDDRGAHEWDYRAARWGDYRICVICDVVEVLS